MARNGINKIIYTIGDKEYTKYVDNWIRFTDQLSIENTDIKVTWKIYTPEGQLAVKGENITEEEQNKK